MEQRYDTIDRMARPITHDEGVRERLLEAAAELVDREGPERVALREIAAAADTSTSAVYTLFGGKAGLLAAVVEDAFRSFGRAQAEAEPRGLRALGLAYREWALRHPARYRLMFGGSLAGVEDGIDEECTIGALLPLARTLTGKTDVRSAEDFRDAMAVWAHVHGAVSLEFAAVAPPAASPDEVYETVLDAVLRAYPGR